MEHVYVIRKTSLRNEDRSLISAFYSLSVTFTGNFLEKLLIWVYLWEGNIFWELGAMRFPRIPTMFMQLLFLCFFLFSVDGHNQPANYNNLPPIPQPHLTPGQNPMHQKAYVEDKAHIKEHLDGISNKRPEDMNEQELQFHYFKLHDTDTNNKLDGLELIHAITHYHGGEVPGPGGNRVLTDQELAMTVDAILLDDDRNNDGFIDYSEFASSQSRNQGANQGKNQ